MRLLFVEPDEYYHSHFKSHFADLGEIVVARAGAEALDLLRGRKIDGLVMEMFFPDYSAYDILDELAARVPRTSFPVIIFSKNSALGDIQETLNRGVNAYFVKGRDSLSDLKKLLLTYAN